MKFIKLLCNHSQKKNTQRELGLNCGCSGAVQGTIWDATNKRYTGTINCGTGHPEVKEYLVTEAIVFMAVGLSGLLKMSSDIYFTKQMFCTSSFTAD